MGRPAGEGDLDEGVAAQARGEGEPGRLPHHGDVRVHPEAGQGGEHGLRAEAGVLLVGDEGEHDAARHRPPHQLLGRDDHRGHAALHVARAAPGEPVPLDRGGERVRHPLDADGVEVAGEHDGGTGGLARADGDQARPVVVAGRRDDVGLEPAALQAVPEVVDGGGLTGGAGHQPGVHRVDGDELEGQRDGGVAEGAVDGVARARSAESSGAVAAPASRWSRWTASTRTSAGSSMATRRPYAAIGEP